MLCVASAHAQDDAAEAAVAKIVPATHAQAAIEPTADWTVTSLITQSSLSNDRSEWRQSSVEALYRPRRLVYGGLRVESRKRADLGDTLYTALFSDQETRALELHAAATYAPDPRFSAHQAFTAGLEWRANTQLSGLFDVSHLNFDAGSIDQYAPGAVWWLTDEQFLSYRYTTGRAFGSRNYEAHALRYDWGNGGPLRLAVGYAHGADPEKDPGLPGVILTTADTASLYSHWRFQRNADLIAGFEYEDRHNVYRRTGITLGVSARF